MAEKLLKSIKIAGLGDTYVLPTSKALTLKKDEGVLYQDGEEVKIPVQSIDGAEGLVFADENDSVASTVPVDADTLGGKLPSDFAPAGFGLGETQSRLLEWEDIDGTRTKMIPTGWYHLDPSLGSITIDGYSMNPVIVRVESNTYGFMAITIINHGQPVVRRGFIQGSWQPWEWISPPMMADVEYRTTERIDNKAIYKKKISSGEILYRLDGETEWRHQNDLVGAAPAVYTYPSGVNGIDANTIVNEYHKFVINCANNPYSHGFLDVVRASAEGFTPNGAVPIIHQTMTEWSTGHKAYRNSVDNGATWGEWVKEYSASNKPTPAEIGAAPSGYGLGEYGAKQVDWGAIDSVTKPGWYRFASGITIGNAWEVASPYMRVDAWDANSCVQTLYSASAPMRKLIRVRSSGVWQDWEFEAVPGYPGYEARLTERWNGKPVYWKLISMGTCAAAGSAVRKQHGISATNFISCRGIIIDGKGTAHELVAGNTLASCYVESGYAIIHSQDSLTSYQGYVELKYTK